MNRRLEGGCQVPIACYAQLESDDSLFLRGLVGAVDGSEILRGSRRGIPADGEAMGIDLAEELLAKGADRILRDVYGER